MSLNTLFVMNPMERRFPRRRLPECFFEWIDYNIHRIFAVNIDAFLRIFKNLCQFPDSFEKLQAGVMQKNSRNKFGRNIVIFRFLL